MNQFHMPHIASLNMPSHSDKVTVMPNRLVTVPSQPGLWMHMHRSGSLSWPFNEQTKDRHVVQGLAFSSFRCNLHEQNRLQRILITTCSDFSGILSTFYYQIDRLCASTSRRLFSRLKSSFHFLPRHLIYAGLFQIVDCHDKIILSKVELTAKGKNRLEAFRPIHRSKDLWGRPEHHPTTK